MNIKLSDKLSFLRFMKERKVIMGQNWDEIIYEKLNNYTSKEVERFIQYLNNCEYIQGNHYEIRITEKGLEYLESLEKKLQSED